MGRQGRPARRAGGDRERSGSGWVFLSYRLKLHVPAEHFIGEPSGLHTLLISTMKFDPMVTASGVTGQRVEALIRSRTAGGW